MAAHLCCSVDTMGGRLGLLESSRSMSSMMALLSFGTSCTDTVESSVVNRIECIFTRAGQPIGDDFTIMEKAPISTRAFSWLKANTSAFTFKNLLRHYTKRKPAISKHEIRLFQPGEGPSREGAFSLIVKS